MKVGWSQFVESQRKPSALTPRPLASQLVHEHKDNLDVDAAVGTLHRLDCKFVHLWVSRGGSQLGRQSKSWSEQSISIKVPLIATINKVEVVNKFTVYCFLSGGEGSRGSLGLKEVGVLHRVRVQVRYVCAMKSECTCWKLFPLHFYYWDMDRTFILPEI